MPDDVENVLISCGEACRSGQQNSHHRKLKRKWRQYCNKGHHATVFFQWKSLDALCLGTGDAAGDELMKCSCDLMGTVCVKQAETCTVTL